MFVSSISLQNNFARKFIAGLAAENGHAIRMIGEMFFVICSLKRFIYFKQ